MATIYSPQYAMWSNQETKKRLHIFICVPQNDMMMSKWWSFSDELFPWRCPSLFLLSDTQRLNALTGHFVFIDWAEIQICCLSPTGACNIREERKQFVNERYSAKRAVREAAKARWHYLFELSRSLSFISVLLMHISAVCNHWLRL